MAIFSRPLDKFNPRFKSFSVLQYIFWSAVACYNPFIVVFLMHKNLSSTMIGFILMLNSLVTLVAQPLWGMVSDKTRSIKKVFLFCFFTSTLIILSLPLYNTVGILAFIFPLITFFFSPLGPLLDSWTVQGIKKLRNKSYGSVRLWGSIGFSFMVVVIGTLVNSTSINSAFIAFGVMSCITMLFSLNFAINNTGNEEGGSDTPKPVKNLDIGRLFKNYYYVTFIFSACLMLMTMSSVYSFLPKLMKQVGGSEAMYGLAQAVSAFSEAPVLFLSRSLLKKFKPLPLILTSILVYALRLFIYSVAGSPMVVIFAQALQGLSYGLFLSGSVHYIDYLAPEELKATAQTTANAVYFGLSGIIGNFAAGRLIDSFGIFFVYRTGALIDIGVFLLFLLSLFIGRKLQENRSSFMRYTPPAL